MLILLLACGCAMDTIQQPGAKLYEISGLLAFVSDSGDSVKANNDKQENGDV